MIKSKVLDSPVGLWAISFAVLVVGFWQGLGSFIPTVDAETVPSGIVPVVLSQGRITSYLLLSLLAPGGNIHPLDLLIGLAGFATAILITVRIWGLTGLPAVAVAVIAASFPTTVHMFTFSTVNMVFGIGMALAAASVWFFARGRAVYAALLILATIGVYQGLLINVIVIYLAWQAIALMRSETTVPRAFLSGTVFLGLIVLCSVLYSIGVAAILSAFGIRLRLVNEILQPWLLIEKPVEMGQAALTFFAHVISGRDPLFVDRGSLIGWLHVVLTAFAFGSLLRVAHHRAVVAALLLTAAVAAPFLSIAITGGAVRYRSLMAAPFALAGLAAVASMWADERMRRAVLTACVLLALLYSQATIQMIRAAHLSWQDDQRLITTILERIAQIDPTLLAHGELRPFEMVGWYDRRSTWIPNVGARTTLGFSFFRYSESASRAVGAFEILGHPFFRPATSAERIEIADRSTTLPNWPDSGAVAVIDGVVVVKFSPYTAFQIGRYCPTTTDPECAALLSGRP